MLHLQVLFYAQQQTLWKSTICNIVYLTIKLDNINKP